MHGILLSCDTELYNDLPTRVVHACSHSCIWGADYMYCVYSFW